MQGILSFVTIMVATVSLAEECEMPGECVGQIVGFVQEDDVTR